MTSSHSHQPLGAEMKVFLKVTVYSGKGALTRYTQYYEEKVKNTWKHVYNSLQG